MQTVDTGGEVAQPVVPPASRRSLAIGIGFDLVAFLILTAGPFLVGCLINLARSDPLPWVYVGRAQAINTALDHLGANGVARIAEEGPGDLPHEIRLEEFQSFVTERKGLVLDARPAVFYRDAHIPGALSLPRETFAEDYPRLRATLELSKNRTIAIYCSGADCPDSQLLTEALTKLGFRRLVIYTSGWEEWSQTGLPQEGASTQP